jgi:hypothetical protein
MKEKRNVLNTAGGCGEAGIPDHRLRRQTASFLTRGHFIYNLSLSFLFAAPLGGIFCALLSLPVNQFDFFHFILYKGRRVF